MNRRIIRLGVNIDHVATIRNARGGFHPDVLRAAKLAEEAGADGITIHCREDRRHIKESDVFNIKKEIKLPLNLEIAATKEMQEIAINALPNACCIVPEKREELTTEGGLDVYSSVKPLSEYIKPLKECGIRISLFIDADKKQIDSATQCGADIIEIHTGKYSEEFPSNHQRELERIIKAAEYAESVGLEVHAGHGLNYENVVAIARIPQIIELNIGHFLIGEAIFCGLSESIKKMRDIIRAV